MKRVLIIYPHFPPSNLAGVHRARLFASHLPSFGWEPVVLTVDEAHYEEKLDHDLTSLLPTGLRIVKVGAGKRRAGVGDIGLRSLDQLYTAALKLLLVEKFDFFLIPVPSYYTALIARDLHAKTSVPYGIDYIDPWVHEFPGSNKLFSKAWFSTKLSKSLEPRAVRNAALITGVAEKYYLPVFERNPRLKQTAISGAMPYGGDIADHKAVRNSGKSAYLFKKSAGIFHFVYAGAMLPKAYSVLEQCFQSISEHKDAFAHVKFHFVGTGKSPDDQQGFNIRPLAEKYRLWNTTVFEYPARISYFDVLLHLEEADGVFILGSTEPHYTPSKLFQGLIAEKPVFAVLHQESTAAGLLQQSGGGILLDFDPQDLSRVRNEFAGKMQAFELFCSNFIPVDFSGKELRVLSAEHSAEVLARLMESAIQKK